MDEIFDLIESVSDGFPTYTSVLLSKTLYFTFIAQLFLKQSFRKQGLLQVEYLGLFMISELRCLKAATPFAPARVEFCFQDGSSTAVQSDNQVQIQ